jgi:hypothetical protein
MTSALLSMGALRDRVREIEIALGGSGEGSPIGFGESSQDGAPHVEIGDAYHYVMCERGTEFTRQTTTDVDELLYWIARDLTFWRAVDHELRNRVDGKDFRRILFQHQRELMERFGEDWSRRLEAEHEGTLASHPFVDGDAPLRGRPE